MMVGVILLSALMGGIAAGWVTSYLQRTKYKKNGF